MGAARGRDKITSVNLVFEPGSPGVTLLSYNLCSVCVYSLGIRLNGNASVTARTVQRPLMREDRLLTQEWISGWTGGRQGRRDGHAAQRFALR